MVPRAFLAQSLSILLLSKATDALVSNAEFSPQILSDLSGVCSDQQGRSETCEVELDVPSSCIEGDSSSSCPIVFFLHGAGGGNAGYARDSGVHSAGFIGVYPQGENGWNTGPKDTNQCAWDDYACTQDPDEGAFIAAIISEIRSQGGEGNIYVIGSSNGGALANRLAVNAGEDLPISGIVSIVTQLLESPDRSGPGVLNYNNPQALSGTGPKVSVLNLMGTADNLIRYEGGSSPVFGGEDAFQLLSALDSMEEWAAHNGCSTVPSTQDVTTSVGTRGVFYQYPNCEAGTLVEHYAIIGGGHDAGRTTIDGIDFSFDVAFDFINRLEGEEGGFPTIATTRPPIPTPTNPPSKHNDLCTDDPSWRGKHDDSHTCFFVSQNPLVRCNWEDSTGVKAHDACAISCDTCQNNTPIPTHAPTTSPNEDEPSCTNDHNWHRNCFIGVLCTIALIFSFC